MAVPQETKNGCAAESQESTGYKKPELDYKFG